MKKRLMVEGMHCANCVKGLNDVLTEDLEGVEVLEISLEGKYADIDAADSVSDDQLKAAVEELGFELKEIKQVSMSSKSNLVCCFFIQEY